MLYGGDDVLHEAVMFKKTRNKEWYSIIKNWAERKITLNRSGIIQYYEGENRLRGKINIKGCTIIRKEKDEIEKPYSFEVISADPKEPTLILAPKTEAEKEVWIRCIMLVAAGLWEAAKDAQTMEAARTMPFLTSLGARDRDSETALSRPSFMGGAVAGGMQSVRLSTMAYLVNDDLFWKAADEHTSVWRNSLTPESRAVVMSLKAQIQNDLQSTRDSSSSSQATARSGKFLRSETEGKSFLNSGVAPESNFIDSTVVKYLGFKEVKLAEGEREAEGTTLILNANGAPSSSSAAPGAGASTRKGTLADVKTQLVHRVHEIDLKYPEEMAYEQWWLFCKPLSGALIPPPLLWKPYQRLAMIGSAEHAKMASFLNQRCNGGKADQTQLCRELSESDEFGHTLLNSVMLYGRREFLAMLLPYAIDLRPHVKAIQDHRLRPGATLLGWLNGETVIHTACTPVRGSDADETKRRSDGQVECLRLYLLAAETNAGALNVDINLAANHSLWTPLHKAAWFGLDRHMTELLKYAKGGKSGVRIDVDKRDSSGFTPFLLACAGGHVECVRLLLAHGADPTLEGGFGGPGASAAELSAPSSLSAKGTAATTATATAATTALYTGLHLAARGGHAAVLECLLSLNTNALSPSLEITPPIWEACITKRHCSLNSDFIGRVEHFAAFSGSVPCLHLCLESSLLTGILSLSTAAVVQTATEGATPLHLAATYGHLEAVQFLLRNSADVNRRSGTRHRTPLLEACRRGRLQVVELLIASGADISERDIAGNTAVHLAAFAGHLPMARALVERFAADVNAQNKDGLTAAALATTRGFAEIADFLNARSLQTTAAVDAIPVAQAPAVRRGSYHSFTTSSLMAMAAAAAGETSKN